MRYKRLVDKVCLVLVQCGKAALDLADAREAALQEERNEGAAAVALAVVILLLGRERVESAAALRLKGAADAAASAGAAGAANTAARCRGGPLGHG